MRSGPLLILGTGVLFAVGVGVGLAWKASIPYGDHSSEGTVVVIEPGESAKSAAARLEAAGVIRSELFFRLLVRLRGEGGRIHAGEYYFDSPLSPGQVLDRLIRGDVVRHRLTIPEGLRIDEVAELVEASGFGERGRLLEQARRIELIRDIDPHARDLEGYLFPDTYFFARGTPESRIVEEMVAGFRRALTSGRLERMSDLGLTVREAVTIASLVEEEAQVDEERARIAAVFHNRLRRGMRLQCDPTVVYALARENRYRGEIYRSDLSYESPYNTYVSPGLPPGPICSPGALSIDAAIFPAATEDLYFVVSGPGRHAFSKSREDHDRAVSKYRQEQRRRRR